MSFPLAIPSAEARAAAARARDLLAHDPRVKLVYVFGSAADPKRDTVRDVDLAVLTEAPLSLDQLVRLRADLVDVIHLPIDLVSLNDASIVLAHEIADSGRCLFAASPEIETDFVVRARARYLDWQPFRDEQWRNAGERIDERRRGA